MQKNTGVKNSGISRSGERNLSRELKREEPQSRMGEGDITDSITKGPAFSKTCEKRRGDELKGGPQGGMGKASIRHDSRTDCLITDKNEELNMHADRMDEAGGYIREGMFKTDMTKKSQGNTLCQPSDGKGKYNRENNVSNTEDSPR